MERFKRSAHNAVHLDYIKCTRYASACSIPYYAVWNNAIFSRYAAVTLQSMNHETDLSKYVPTAQDGIATILQKLKINIWFDRERYFLKGNHLGFCIKRLLLSTLQKIKKFDESATHFNSYHSASLISTSTIVAPHGCEAIKWGSIKIPHILLIATSRCHTTN